MAVRHHQRMGQANAADSPQATMATDFRIETKALPRIACRVDSLVSQIPRTLALYALEGSSSYQNDWFKLEKRRFRS
jgi:hypothetical protein